ncbi:transcriptional repressor [Mycolicibacterium senegalense]|uniref:Ferric uptake regulator n=2 Tax=Mycolicibacterium TaxID=1866885 RepID=A0A378W617_9MYCO|nr:transcriptional repressor [Mycolicibacterium senegalense]CDP86733.1 ferric uptake regulator [Mycolicibacterium farcinogenes]MCV7336133.1 transcriptional repressor [Mycolicibacterium senegalense]MDR7287859.1 Fe2+ or Zn2+ uptake regulation protein [Mycolicibacterium senegalense]QZA24872.1 transcriptional repressor [Mycolicibacterium senegalense]SUA28563.1 ferric uptake regulator [Mycolicibacterium senegalense]
MRPGNRVPAERLREHLLNTLERTSGPMTTAQLRDDMHQHFRAPVVIESVYRNLTVLERRGAVQRRKLQGRYAHWSRTADQAEI